MGEREGFRIESGVRQGCHVPLDLQRVYGCSDEIGESGDGEDGSKISGGEKRG